jgi:hypothetical protein
VVPVEGADPERAGERQAEQCVRVESSDEEEEVSPVTPPKHPRRQEWRGRPVTEIWLFVVFPVLVMWVLFLTSPGSSMGTAEGARYALGFLGHLAAAHVGTRWTVMWCPHLVRRPLAGDRKALTSKTLGAGADLTPVLISVPWSG